MVDLIFHPDVQFEGPADIEKAVYGTDAAIHISASHDLGRIPDEIWAKAAAVVCYHEIDISGPTLDRLPMCRVVVRAGVGFDNIDLEAAARRGIAVCNTPDYGTMDVADHAIALTMALLRGIPMYNSKIFDDPVKGWRFENVPTIRRLSTQTFGVLGLGRIGTAAALRAKALGMRVIFFDPYRATGSELAIGVERVSSLAELLAQSDVLSLHTPLTRETRHIIGAAELAAMKETAVLVNTARGAVVDLAALAQALLKGEIAAAGIDVLDVEPPTPDHPLIAAWRAPNSGIRHKLLISPHAAFYSPSSLVDLRRKSAQTALGYLKTGQSRDCLNADLIDRTAADWRAALAQDPQRAA